jgi:hypothetical protein
MVGLDADQGWYEIANAREFRPLAADSPEFAAVLVEELRSHLAGLVRDWHRKSPVGDLWITWSPPDALRVGFGTDYCTMRWDQAPEGVSLTAQSMVEMMADQWPLEPRSSA